MGYHSKKWTPAELIYPMGKQERAADHKGMRYFDNIVQGCDVLIKTDHLNNTFNEPGGHNVRVTRQMVELDSKYGVKFEHLAGVLNTRANGLSRHEILDEMPRSALKQLCKVSALDRETQMRHILPRSKRFRKRKKKEMTYARQSRQIKRRCLWLKRFQWNQSCHLQRQNLGAT